MPTISVNLSDKAYATVVTWEKGKRSARISAAIAVWHSQMMASERYLEEIGVKEVEE